MRIGAVFPQTEIGNDPAVIREWTQTVEGLGYRHIHAYDHVLGASLRSRPNWTRAYNSATSFHEVFVLFGYMAALTTAVELVTGVIILPQRQTALVAKQAASLDVLSGGRVRLGVGIGWNAVEYEGLNENFRNRGARIEEQIALLRALWADTAITFKGKWHTIPDAGINPLPVQRPIPVWIGGSAEAVLERTGRIGDGYFPERGPDEEARGMIERLREYARAAGRDPDTVGIDPRLSLNQVPLEQAADYAAQWRALGATHLTVNTMGMKFTSVDEHLTALRRAMEALAG